MLHTISLSLACSSTALHPPVSNHLLSGIQNPSCEKTEVAVNIEHQQEH